MRLTSTKGPGRNPWSVETLPAQELGCETSTKGPGRNPWSEEDGEMLTQDSFKPQRRDQGETPGQGLSRRRYRARPPYLNEGTREKPLVRARHASAASERSKPQRRDQGETLVRTVIGRVVWFCIPPQRRDQGETPGQPGRRSPPSTPSSDLNEGTREKPLVSCRSRSSSCLSCHLNDGTREKPLVSTANLWASVALPSYLNEGTREKPLVSLA